MGKVKELTESAYIGFEGPRKSPDFVADRNAQELRVCTRPLMHRGRRHTQARA